MFVRTGYQLNLAQYSPPRCEGGCKFQKTSKRQVRVITFSIYVRVYVSIFEINIHVQTHRAMVVLV